MWPYQIWAIKTLGLRNNERKYTLIFIFTSTVLSAACMTRAYVLVMKGRCFVPKQSGYGTDRGISVWLVEAQAVRIHGSRCAPLFTAVVEPNTFTATVEQAKQYDPWHPRGILGPVVVDGRATPGASGHAGERPVCVRDRRTSPRAKRRFWRVQ